MHYMVVFMKLFMPESGKRFSSVTGGSFMEGL